MDIIPQDETPLVIQEGEAITFKHDSYIDIRESSEIEDYTGSYVFTPSGEQQTIPINNKRATRNITIEPIPQNYGLITWNGSTLTVS